MRKLSVADFFVEFLIANDVHDVFGYQGGMIAYIFDSLGKYRDRINYHSCATEQGAALAACGYAQATNKLGVAISTSGPGFTNLLTGMANAWFDSVPVLFVSGNVNTKDKKRNRSLRQLGFQEIQAAAMADEIVKKTYEMELDSDYAEVLRDAYTMAMSQRRGPVFIDLPINVCREGVQIDEAEKVIVNQERQETEAAKILAMLQSSQRPVIIAGAGIKQADETERFRELIEILKVPVVSTLPAVDILPTTSEYMMGYIGGTGRREAGIALQNADFVLAIGTRLCSKQIGHNMDLFAPQAKTFVRIDIDETELERKLKEQEMQMHTGIAAFLDAAAAYLKQNKWLPNYDKWANTCGKIYELLRQCDLTEMNQFIKEITEILPEKANLLIDVGKNMTYCGQSAFIKRGTKIFMSAGLGTMGYALPAAIGAYYGNHYPTYAIMGDGGAQMNIQELNTIVKNNLPIKIIVLNNRALGNIRTFQEQYLNSRFVATEEKEGDYFSCDFAAIAQAYGMDVYSTEHLKKSVLLENKLLDEKHAFLAEIIYDDCGVLPGIVAGGEYLKEKTGISENILGDILRDLAQCM